tara:strand:+ start:270 stop:422 length:153 start_codon:yes stop_codon:yes gene_type:complete
MVVSYKWRGFVIPPLHFAVGTASGQEQLPKYEILCTQGLDGAELYYATVA